MTDTEPVPAGDFARDTDVWRDSEVAGRYHANLSEAWKVFYVFGGCTMAVALRAAQRALDRPDLHPVTANAVFAAPVPCGAIVIDTDVLRSGRSAAQVTARLRHADSEGTDIHLSAIFGATHATHVDFVDLTYPEDALPVEEAEAPPPPPEGSPFQRINYHEQTEWLMGSSGFPLGDAQRWEPGPARTLSWHRLIKEPRLPDGTLDPVALCAPADVLGPAVFARLGPPGPGNPPFLSLSLEISLQFVAPTTSAWILQHTQVPVAGNGYAFGVVELWDPERRLVAMATQRAHIRPVDPARFAEPAGDA